MLPLERLKKTNTVSNLWIWILSILKKREIHAWDLPKEIEKNFGFRPGKITPYRVLYRLERQGLVKSEIKERKRVYRITQRGLEELKKAKEFFKEILEKL